MVVEVEYKAIPGANTIDWGEMYVGVDSCEEKYLFMVIRKPHDMRNACKGKENDGYAIISVDNCEILKHPSGSIWYKTLEDVQEALKTEYSFIQKVESISVESFGE